jgi:hypothetical protein
MADCYRVGIAKRLCSMHAVLYIFQHQQWSFFHYRKKGGERWVLGA